MTVTVAPTAPAASPDSAVARSPSPPRRTPRTGLGAAPEVALTGVTVAAVIGLQRLFNNNSFLGPVVLAAVTSHALSWACRRFRLGVVLAALLSLVGLAAFIGLIIEPSTT